MHCQGPIIRFYSANDITHRDAPWKGRIIRLLRAVRRKQVPTVGVYPGVGRINLFLRWMVRKDAVDAGGWSRIVVIQRFGGALNLNLHFHALVLDGVFTPGREGLRFHALARLTTLDVEEVLATIDPLIERLIRHRGLAADGRETGALERRRRRCWPGWRRLRCRARRR